MPSDDGYSVSDRRGGGNRPPAARVRELPPGSGKGLITLAVLDEEGFPADLELRALIVRLDLGLDDIRTLAAGVKRAIAAGRRTVDPRKGRTAFWRDREVLTRLEAELDRDLTLKDCLSEGGNVPGKAGSTPESRGERLWSVYRQMKAEREGVEFALGVPKSGKID